MKVIIPLVIISIVLLMFIIIGISIMKSKKPVQYLSNSSEIPKVNDVEGYNKSLGKIFIIFGLLLVPMMIPIVLTSQNSGLGILTILFAPFWVIGIIVSCICVESKYKSK